MLEPVIEISRDVTEILLSPKGVVGVRVAVDTELHEIGQVKLARFENPTKLRVINNWILVKTDDSGEPIIANPGEDGMP